MTLSAAVDGGGAFDGIKGLFWACNSRCSAGFHLPDRSRVHQLSVEFELDQTRLGSRVRVSRPVGGLTSTSLIGTWPRLCTGALFIDCRGGPAAYPARWKPKAIARTTYHALNAFSVVPALRLRSQ